LDDGPGSFGGVLLSLKIPRLREAVVLGHDLRKNGIMRPLVGLIVAAGVLFGIYQYYLRQLPVTDSGTSPTQAISLTGVRSDLLQIAQAERSNIAVNSNCVSLDTLISSGALSMARRERDGYAYQVNCSGSDFQVVAQHAPAPGGSPIRYPTLAIDSNMQIGETSPH
jgi:hypothetical protein